MIEQKLHEGCFVTVDTGFDCLSPEDIHKVKYDKNVEEFYVECDKGKHYIRDDESGFTVIEKT